MATKLFIGGLPFSVTDEELAEFFAEYGTVTSATVIKERDTGRSKGFGFVEFETEEEAKAAVEGANGKDMGGRNINVAEARPREDRGPRN